MSKSTWKKATPEQMVRTQKKELATTPFWRLGKRWQLKDSIKFWESQLNTSRDKEK